MSYKMKCLRCDEDYFSDDNIQSYCSLDCFLLGPSKDNIDKIPLIVSNGEIIHSKDNRDKAMIGSFWRDELNMKDELLLLLRKYNFKEIHIMNNRRADIEVSYNNYICIFELKNRGGDFIGCQGLGQLLYYLYYANMSLSKGNIIKCFLVLSSNSNYYKNLYELMKQYIKYDIKILLFSPETIKSDENKEAFIKSIISTLVEKEGE